MWAADACGAERVEIGFSFNPDGRLVYDNENHFGKILEFMVRWNAQKHTQVVSSANCGSYTGVQTVADLYPRSLHAIYPNQADGISAQEQDELGILERGSARRRQIEAKMRIISVDDVSRIVRKHRPRVVSICCGEWEVDQLAYLRNQLHRSTIPSYAL